MKTASHRISTTSKMRRSHHHSFLQMFFSPTYIAFFPLTAFSECISCSLVLPPPQPLFHSAACLRDVCGPQLCANYITLQVALQGGYGYF